MLIIKNLTIKDLKNHILIENFNYSLGSCDKVGIIGEEGNGKSTFLKSIFNKHWIDEYMVMSGEIQTDYHTIGYLPQQLPKEWENETVCDYLLKHDPKDEILYESYNDLRNYELLCKELKLSTTLLQSEQTMRTLSGGEKVKVQLMKLFARHIDLLLLDEPTNDLDIQTLEWMETFIKQSNIPIMFISHDIALLNNAANTIIHFEQLNKQSKCHSTIFHGSYNAYVITREQKRSKDMQIAQKEKQVYMKKKILLNNQRNAVHDALNDTVRNPGQGALLKKKMANIKAQEKKYEKEGFSKIDSVEESIDVFFDDIKVHDAKRIIEFSRKTIEIDGTILIQDIHLFIKGKDKCVFIGNNGCGKSLLMKELYNVLLDREDIKLGYMPQNYKDEMNYNDTPISFLMEDGDKGDITTCRDLLGRMKFTSEEMINKIMNLSEGQKAKLYILRFIKFRCNVLLLDEPTRNLSPLSSPVIINVLKEFKGCIIAVSHDRNLISSIDWTIFEIRNKQLQKKEPSA